MARLRRCPLERAAIGGTGERFRPPVSQWSRSAMTSRSRPKRNARAGISIPVARRAAGGFADVFRLSKRGGGHGASLTDCVVGKCRIVALYCAGQYQYNVPVQYW